MYQKWKTKRALQFYRPIIEDDTDGKTDSPQGLGPPVRTLFHNDWDLTPFFTLAPNPSSLTIVYDRKRATGKKSHAISFFPTAESRGYIFKENIPRIFRAAPSYEMERSMAGGNCLL